MGHVMEIAMWFCEWTMGESMQRRTMIWGIGER